jgi:hypothetical protein
MARQVSEWRNDRIHGEVRFIDNRLILVGDDDQPLQINETICMEKANLAIQALVEMQAHVPFLVSCLDLDDAIDEVLKPSGTSR